MTSRQTVLLICDDHRTLTDALKMVVDRDPAFSMPAAPVQSPEEAIALSKKFKPDVVLMDITFKGHMSGIEATRRIKELSPATNVVIMTAHEDERLMVDAVEAGASGFLTKNCAVDELLTAARASAQGEALIDPADLTRLLHRVSKERAQQREALERLSALTNRERQVLQLLAEGKRNDEIAKDLGGLSTQTVQTHIRNALEKLEVHSKLEAVAVAVKNGVVTV